MTVGLSRSAFVQRLCVSVGRGSRQSTSLRPQGAKAPEEPLTACRVGGWSIKFPVVVLCSAMMFPSFESFSRLERRILHVIQVPSAVSVTVLVFGGDFRFSSVSLFFLSCLLVILR